VTCATRLIPSSGRRLARENPASLGEQRAGVSLSRRGESCPSRPYDGAVTPFPGMGSSALPRCPQNHMARSFKTWIVAEYEGAPHGEKSTVRSPRCCGVQACSTPTSRSGRRLVTPAPWLDWTVSNLRGGRAGDA